jgi:hypothetical protein
MSKTDALAQLERFFYQGLEHKGVQLPAAINSLRSKRLNIAVGDIYNQPNYLSVFKIMNPISLKTNFARILLLSTALVISINAFSLNLTKQV